MSWYGELVKEQTLYRLLFVDDQVFVARDKDDSSCMARKIGDKY